MPDDRKVNPWDLNELNPTDNGTMGTIPGPVIECEVGDTVKVHFRNMDNRVTFKKICFPPFDFPPFELGKIALGEIPFPLGKPEIKTPFDICLNLPVKLPVEKRTHSLHPHGFVFAPTSDGAYSLSPPDPAQAVAGGAGARAE